MRDSMAGTSVVTLNKNRRPHLLRLLEGLAREGASPDECVVIEMGEDEGPLPAFPFPVTRRSLRRDGLPLAAARNAGRDAARGDNLVFLDVDCIPSESLVPRLGGLLASHDALICCAIRYLPAGAVRDGWSEAELRRAGQLHPVRNFPEEGVAEESNAGLFWSLAFAVRAATFDRIGGFDEGFTGYGAEDTDFSFRAREAGIPLLFAGGTCAYHQHHDGYDPPLQHFDDIIANARRFRARHGFWPMDGWLDAFAARGLIAADRRQDIDILRRPTAAEMEAARLPADRVF